MGTILRQKQVLMQFFKKIFATYLKIKYICNVTLGGESFTKQFIN